VSLLWAPLIAKRGPSARRFFAGRGGAPYAARVTWLKGNLHTHSTLSDGDSEPADVIAWYRDHGWDFIALTDHNKLEVHDGGPLIVIPSEEVSSVGAGRPVHVNAFGPRHRVLPIQGDSVAGTLRATVAASNAAGAIASVNHPNFRWGLDLEALLAGAGAGLLEVWNGHPEVANAGDRKHASVESLWDQCLGLGRWYWGVAVDDMHHLRTISSDKANPGRGWVMVRAQKSVDGVLRALAAGDFYASTGVTLSRVELGAGRVGLTVDGEGAFHVEIVGAGGRILYETDERVVDWESGPGDGYLRARITGPGGSKAWTQPVAMRPKAPT